MRPWLKDCWCIPPQASGEFVAQMEEVLDVYQQPADPDRPLVCMDEASKQLVGETRPPLPARPGDTAHEDYEYVRNGVANLFMFYSPLLGWRQRPPCGRRRVTDRRTRLDWAHAIPGALRALVDVYFPTATKIRLVCDNLNTHTAGVRREARHHIPGAAGKHSKEVFGLPAYLRSKDQGNKSMLGEGRDCRKMLYGRKRSTRPTW